MPVVPSRALEKSPLLNCPVCSSEVPPGSRFCAGCGAALSLRQAEPTGPYEPDGESPAPRPPISPPALGEPSRFTPGQILAGRYRIVTPLGRGGMGEVYRADDLALGQAVALKFLAGRFAADPDRLARFRKEVRMARQVSHPNVCRVYDLGEAEGQLFLTMEYIDGEDLASLLRRIGRLPQDKGVELSRQLCMGLAAAHERGVLHRDLKPGNVMIDGRGQVRLTDFGLAGFAGGFEGAEVRAGTPAYMAPEQQAGLEVTVQSDLYALGLVLYELFTGRRAFPAKSREELRRLQAEATPSKPSSHVPGFDPVAEKIILRCLQKDPKDRPRSALAVATALPGGDQLAAALAAGETPSPEMVAEAGEDGTLRPVVAVSMLVAFLIGLVLIAFLSDQVALFRKVPLDLPPAVLANKAQDILKNLGEHESAGDSAYGFTIDRQCLGYLLDKDTAPDRWEGLATGQPAVMYFWYRQSPYEMVAQHVGLDLYPGRVFRDDPPELVSGMTSVILDLKGRLLEYHLVPRRDDYTDGPAPEPDWGPFFAAADLDLDRFMPATPQWSPPYFSDRPRAWVGTYPDRPDLPLRIEAASVQGKTVFFQLVGGPWSKPERASDFLPVARASIEDSTYLALLALALGGGALLARRNLRLGRADRRGWLLYGALFAIVQMATCLCAPGKVLALNGSIGLVIRGLGLTALNMGIISVLYLAAEPAVRRRWPRLITSWNRLFSGRWRDPLVGRDFLAGGLVGLILPLVFLGSAWSAVLHGQPPRPVDLVNLQAFSNATFGTLTKLTASTQSAWIYVTLLLLAFLLTRKFWLALLVDYLVAWAFNFLNGGDISLAGLVSQGLAVAAGAFLLARFGVLALAVGLYVAWSVLSCPLTLHYSAWYFSTPAICQLVVTGLMTYGCIISLGGRPLIGPGFFGED
jgi:Protein kinase domain